VNKLHNQLVKFEQFGDIEQLELFISKSGASILAEELGDMVAGGVIDLEEYLSER
jgi:hypothetical protein